MSNPIRYDPLLVRYLAGELHERLAGRSCAAAPLFAEDRSAVLPLDDGEALRLDLHPMRGWVRIVPHTEMPELPAVCTRVTAPADERILHLHLQTEQRFRSRQRRLVVELHTNQWNALLLDEDGRIVSVLRARSAGHRELRAGEVYESLLPPSRYGSGTVGRADALGEWQRVLGASPPEARTRLLVRHFAYTGSLNAASLLGEAARVVDAAELDAAFERWWRMRAIENASPVLLTLPFGRQPYPLALPGTDAAPAASLLDAMAAVVAEPEREAAEMRAPPPDSLRELAWERRDAALRRAGRLREQLSAAADAEVMRGWGDLLLAHLHAVPRGADSVRLPGWEGGEVEIEMDPALSPADNAAQWYTRARRRTRAAERLPALIREAESEAGRWAEAANAPELPDWAVDHLHAGPAAGQTTTAKPDEAAPPYRSFRSSGGLEVRVGRSAKDNDRLTFGHSAPDDIWLHARSVPGSHVILRWSNTRDAPPARDLAEAATLAAVNSKARSSGLVAVDWTRRKRVRKPRGAPPGSVIPQQVKTLFVEPDPTLEERLMPDALPPAETPSPG